MPARWPSSDTDVSQLPRWPIVSLRVSCADADAKGPSASALQAATSSTFRFLTTSSLWPLLIVQSSQQRTLAALQRARTPVTRWRIVALRHRELFQQLGRIAIALRTGNDFRIAQRHQEALVDQSAIAGGHRAIIAHQIHVDVRLLPVRH